MKKMIPPALTLAVLLGLLCSLCRLRLRRRGVFVAYDPKDDC